MKKEGLFDSVVYEKIYPTGSQPARIYGLPKIHKIKGDVTLPPLRPIVSSIGTYNYNLAKYLSGLLSPIIPMNHCAKDSFSFVKDLKSVNPLNKFTVSFDVVSLFTNVPLAESINLPVDLILKSHNNLKLSKDHLTKLFEFACHFGNSLSV